MPLPPRKEKQMGWKEYVFEDGYRCQCRGMDKIELAHEELKHGKLISVKEI